jgi:hypothetical protein
MIQVLHGLKEFKKSIQKIFSGEKVRKNIELKKRFAKIIFNFLLSENVLLVVFIFRVGKFSHQE